MGRTVRYILIGALAAVALLGWIVQFVDVPFIPTRQQLAFEQQLRSEKLARWINRRLGKEDEVLPETVPQVLSSDEALAKSIDLLSDGRQSDAEEVISDAAKDHFDDRELLFAKGVLERSRWGLFSSKMWFGLVQRKARGTEFAWAARLSRLIDKGRDVQKNLEELVGLADEHPDHIYLLWLSAIECREAKNGELGQRQYEKLLAKFRVGPVMVHHTYANILTEELGEYEKALHHRYIAVSMSPRSWTYEGLADTLLYLEQYELSNVMWLNAISMDSTVARYYDRRGDALYHLQRYDEMMDCYLCAEKMGSIYAGADIAVCYEKGIGVPADDGLAVEWFHRAADRGNAWAQYKLGWCLKEGHGVEKNEAQAVNWFKKSAENGNSDAQLDMGFCCEKGQGVYKDMKKAVEWYEKSSAQGNLMALNNLGLCYQDGKGVEKNYEKAVELYCKALDIDPDHARTLNSYAWLMLTSDDESFHNYPEAVQMAERSVGLDEQGFSLDTLAVAYFKNGQFDKAVDTQERLIDFRKRRSPNEAVPERMMKRLEEYETKRVEAEDRGSAGELL